jgi:heme/copper-type cytochrome/quinol oxidase subunit 2
MNVTYRQIIAAAAVIAGVVFLVTGIRADEAPFLAVGGAILGVAALAASFDRWWAIVPAIVIGGAGAAHAPIMIPMLEYPESANDFAPALVSLVLGAAVVVLGVTDLVARRRRTGTFVAPAVLRASTTVLGAIVLAIVASTAVSVTRDASKVDASDRVGALIVTYDGFNVEQESLNASAGRPTRIVVDNEDAFVHDFALEGTDVRFGLGPNEEKMAEFTIEKPGEYTYRCTLTGHGNMKGTLTVE